MIQLVPPVNEAAIDFIEENIKDMQSVTKMLEDGLSPEEIALKGLKGLDGEILDSWKRSITVTAQESVPSRC